MLFVMMGLAVFFALNMGGASFAASFSAPFGGKILNRFQAAVLFMLFVMLGAVVFGQKVSHTLGESLVPINLLDNRAVIVIFLSAGLSMFIANISNIPQSTSIVTVAVIAGVGLYYQQLNLKMVSLLIPMWLILPWASYLITHGIAGYVYPPRQGNFWIYQKFVNQRSKLRGFVIIASCYNAFSVGTNNVANVVGPLMGVSRLNLVLLLLIFAGVYGAGAFLFSGPIKTAGQKIVPLGLLTASIISLVSGTLMLFASWVGIPQSFVMLQMGALFAVSSVKHGSDYTFENPLIRKTFYTWTVNPLITLLISYALSWLIIR